MGDGRISAGILSFFDAMRQNIEIFLRVGEEDEEQIHEILERDWEKAHAPLVGVQL